MFSVLGLEWIYRPRRVEWIKPGIQRYNTQDLSTRVFYEPHFHVPKLGYVDIKERYPYGGSVEKGDYLATLSGDEVLICYTEMYAGDLWDYPGAPLWMVCEGDGVKLEKRQLIERRGRLRVGSPISGDEMRTPLLLRAYETAMLIPDSPLQTDQAEYLVSGQARRHFSRRFKGCSEDLVERMRRSRLAESRDLRALSFVQKGERWRYSRDGDCLMLAQQLDEERYKIVTCWRVPG